MDLFRADGDKTLHLAEVNFQWKNPDFLFKNPDFRLKNVDFIIKQADRQELGMKEVILH